MQHNGIDPCGPGIRTLGQTDGQIGEFKPGAAWIARRAGVPVLPVHVAGTAAILPKGRTVPHRSHVEIAFGDPMEPHDGEDARAFNERIEAAVRALAGGSGTDL